MLKSIYTPLSGALTSERALEIISNNLANINTTGFKSEKASFKLLDPEPYQHYRNPLPPANYKIPYEELLPFRGNEVSYVGISRTSSDFSQGAAKQTSNPLDLMIEKEGFFSVQTKDGRRFTRDGAFSISQAGALVDKNGSTVLGSKGAIFLGSGKVEINALGEIYQDGEYLDRILIHKFKDHVNLEKTGSNHYFYKGLEEDILEVSSPSIKQGYLEAANVNPIRNLTDMIVAHRSFEAYQQAIKNFDSMMEKSSNSLGEVRG